VAECKDKPINSFVISNLSDMNYYVLTAPDKVQCTKWIEAVRASIELSKTDSVEVEVIYKSSFPTRLMITLFICKGKARYHGEERSRAHVCSQRG